jgi:hypothetical protein
MIFPHHFISYHIIIVCLVQIGDGKELAGIEHGLLGMRRNGSRCLVVPPSYVCFHCTLICESFTMHNSPI